MPGWHPTSATLERTAALTRFDAEIAGTLSGRDGHARALLESLARRGLLRTFGTGVQASYACHDLVRRFIRQEIETAGGPPPGGRSKQIRPRRWWHAVSPSAGSVTTSPRAATGTPRRCCVNWGRESSPEAVPRHCSST